MSAARRGQAPPRGFCARLPLAAARRGLALIALAAAQGVTGEEAMVAAAANFAQPLARLQTAFAEGDHRINVVLGATGKLYAQIVHGAPFDVFLAADRERPCRLAASGLAVAASQRTYALGRLALWSAHAHRAGVAQRLRSGAYRHLAIANPRLAPYGAAAMQTLRAMGLLEAGAATRLVVAENAGQAKALVATGAAELGFVALSHVMEAPAAGSRWAVPKHLHEPIRQDAVLLRRGRDNPAARAFLAFLASEAAARIIADAGYGAPSSTGA